MSFILPYHIIERRPQLRFPGISPHHILQLLLSFFLFAPTVANLVLVCVWRSVGSGLSLRGRCHWSPDAVWVGVGGQCSPHAPPWGVWLTAAILRLILTAVALVRHFTNRVIAYLIYELCRSHIFLHREVIVHYGCPSVIVPRTSEIWTLSRYPRYRKSARLVDLPLLYLSSIIKVPVGGSHSVLYPVVEWRPYPSGAIPQIGSIIRSIMNKRIQDPIPPKVPRYPTRESRNRDRPSLALPRRRPSHCDVRTVHETCKWPRVPQDLRRSSPMSERRTYKDSLTNSAPSLIGYPANSRNLGSRKTRVESHTRHPYTMFLTRTHPI